MGTTTSTTHRLANLTNDELDILDAHYSRSLEFGDDAELEHRYNEVQAGLNARRPFILDAA
jgi:hypothetical protein